MQNQPKTVYPIKNEAYPLDTSFPLYYFIHSPPKGAVSNVHYHPFLEIGYCLQGSGLFFIDHNVHSFTKNDIFVVYQNQIHKAQSFDSSSEWLFFYCNPESIFKDYPLEDVYLISSCSVSTHKNKVSNKGTLIKYLQEMGRELAEKRKGFQSLSRSLLCSFLVSYQRIGLRPAVQQKPVSGYGEGMLRLGPAMQYISTHYCETIVVQQLADLCYMSLTSLRRYFANYVGMSPLEYITHVRIKSALVLLCSTNKLISEIAGAVGFGSLSSFNRAFQKIISCSPSEYREDMKESIIPH